MNKDSYNIDSILDEVKKRREENEKEIKERVSQEAEKAPAPAVEPEKAEEINEKIVEDEPAPAEPIAEPVIEEAPAVESVEEPAEEVEAPVIDEPEVIDTTDEGEIIEGTSLVEMADEPKKKKDKKKKAKNPKKKKILWTIIIILLIIVIGLGIFAYFYINNMLNQIANNNSSGYSDDVNRDEWQGMDGNEESFDPIYETEASQLSSLQDMIKTWYYNGSSCSSSKVLNVLLIGEDTRGSEILDDGTRADAAIIASINAETQQITLTSILRDTYSYFESTPNNEETGTFEKINGAMSIGNINAYINCVQNLYKIKIDNYVIVNFDSFESIVDTLGGVTLEITSAEINEINNHQARYGNVTIDKAFDGNSGEMKLTGEQALAYCRIRKLDSDNKRADRQKTCLIKLFEEAKDASNIQLLKLMKTVTPYISTGFDKNELTKIAEYALKNNWLGFKTQMTSVPEAHLNEKGAGGVFYGAWCWKSDFPQDAYDLQMLIYGKSNITLAHSRVNVLTCPEKGFYNKGADPIGSWATITNDHYGEVTTTQLVAEEETETTTIAN